MKSIKEIHDLYDKWGSQALKEGGDLLKAINEIEEIKPKRGEKCRLELALHVKNACFFAANYDNGEIEDGSKEIRESLNAIRREIPAQERAASEIISFFKRYPDPAIVSVELGLQMSEDEPIPGENLANLLERYKTGLAQGQSEIVDKALPWWKVFGALEYLKPLDKQAFTKNPYINSFIFCLAFLFRHYTNPKQGDNEWFPPSLSGEMPSFGKPNYPTIALLTHAIFPKLSLGEKEISDRLYHLKKKKVKFRSWMDSGS